MNKPELLSDVLILVGCALLVTGFAFIYRPAAFLAAGLLCIALAWIFAVGAMKRGKDKT